MKKAFAILVTVFLLAATLSGCGSSGVMNSPAGDGGETTDATTSSGGLGSGNTYSWRLASCWPQGNSLLEVDQRFAELVGELSGGNFTITVYPAGELGASNAVLDLVGNGTVECGGDWAGYWSGKNTAFDLLGSCMDNFSVMDYYMWVYEGGGYEDAYQYLYNQYNIQPLPTSFSCAESGLRSTVPIESLEDLSSLKVRISGKMQGIVAEKIGFTPVTIDSSELYESLQRGVVEAGEFSGPKADDSLRLQEVAKYWLTPGWHQSAGMNCALVNLDAWNALAAEDQSMLMYAAKLCAAEMLAAKTWEDAEVSAKMIQEEGVIVTTLSEEDMATLRQYVLEAYDQCCEENPDFAKVYESMCNYRETMDTYRTVLGDYGFGFNYDN